MKPDWYWGFWEWAYKTALERELAEKLAFAEMGASSGVNEFEVAAKWANAACAERMKREKE